METFPKDPIKMVEAWTISGGEKKVMGPGDAGISVWVMEGQG